MVAELLTRYNATDARRHFHSVLEEAVQRDRPVVIDPRDMAETIMLSREQFLRALAPYVFHTRVIPEEEDGGFTLWVEELALGEHGATVREARDALLASVYASAAHFLAKWDFYRHVPDQAERFFYYIRIALADDRELKRMLFAPQPPGASTAPTRETAGVM